MKSTQPVKAFAVLSPENKIHLNWIRYSKQDAEELFESLVAMGHKVSKITQVVISQHGK